MQVIILNDQNGQGIFVINIDTDKIDATKFTQWRALIIAEVKIRFNVDLTAEDIARIKFRPKNDSSIPGVTFTDDAVSIPVQPPSAFITIRLPQLKTELLLRKKCEEIANSFNQIFDILIEQEEVLDERYIVRFHGNMRYMPGGGGMLCSIKGECTRRSMLKLVEEGLEKHYKEAIDCEYQFNTRCISLKDDPDCSMVDLNISSAKYNFFSFDPNVLLSYLKNRIVNIAGLTPVIKKSEARARHEALKLLIGAIENNAALALSIIRDGKVYIDGIIGPYGYPYSYLVPLYVATSHKPWDVQRITTDTERAEIARQLILKGANIAVSFPVTGGPAKTLLDPDRLSPLTEPGKVLMEAAYVQAELLVSDHPEIVDPQELKPLFSKSCLKKEQIDVILSFVSLPNPKVVSILNRISQFWGQHHISQLKQLGKTICESRQSIKPESESSGPASGPKGSETLLQRLDTVMELSRMSVLSLPASAIDTPKMPSMTIQPKQATLGTNVANSASRRSFILKQAGVVANNRRQIIVPEPANSVATIRPPVDKKQEISTRLKTSSENVGVSLTARQMVELELIEGAEKLRLSARNT